MARRGAVAPARKGAAKPTRTARPTAKPRAAAKRPKISRAKVTTKPRAKQRTGAAGPTLRHRHALFIDVENTSSEDSLFEVLDQVHIDRRAEVVQVTAVGNWRVASQRLARRLAGMGAELRHSAPATGVKDWSDLWIAVAAGFWLGRAEPGDVLEIVSNDRAFDAVGDTAAALGVDYRRLMLKRGGAAAAREEEVDDAPPKRRRSRGGRRRRGRGSAGTTASAPARAVAAEPAPIAHQAPAPRHPAPQRHQHLEAEPHGATRDQITALIERLTSGDSGRWVNLDILEKALKQEGFARPAGSPRLVTRLRMLKEVEVDSHGRVRIVAAPPAEEPTPEPAPPASEDTTAPKRKRAAPRRRRTRKPSAGSNGNGDGGMEAGAFSAAPLAFSDPPAE